MNFLEINGNDILNIVYQYQFEMEREDRVREHKLTFNRTLLRVIWVGEDGGMEDYFGGIRNKRRLNKMLSVMNYENEDGTIEVCFDMEDDIKYRDFNLYGEWRNMNNWTGFSKKELLCDIIFNWRNMNNYVDRNDFVEEMIGDSEDIEDYEVEMLKYNRWFDGMENMSNLMLDLLDSMDIDGEDRDDFEDYCLNEL